MSWLYYTSVSVHVLAAMLWLGGMLFLGLVGAPALRSVEPPQLRQALFRDIGTRFRGVGWAAIATLVVTGILNLHFRGWLASAFASSAFWSTTPGRALAMKLIAVLTMILVSAFHDFVHGPRASRFAPGTPDAIAARRTAMLLARFNALVGIVIVLIAVRLARA
jgi:uncharacterized membrane protein